MSHSAVTVDDVLALTAPTDRFLCPLAANTYGIEFSNFVIKDYETKRTIFTVGRDNPPTMDMTQIDPNDPDSYRRIRYTFSEDVLRLPTIETQLVFSVGQAEVPGFRMVERHYFRDRLVKSFDFEFGFVIPGSTNEWSAVYSLPLLEDELIAEMVASPFETTSDSFYFADGRLIMHNKASYRYTAEDAAQSKSVSDRRAAAKAAKAAKGAKAPSKRSGEGSDDDGDADDDDDGDRFAGSKAYKGSKDDDNDEYYQTKWSKEEDYY